MCVWCGAVCVFRGAVFCLCVCVCVCVCVSVCVVLCGAVCVCWLWCCAYVSWCGAVWCGAVQVAKEKLAEFVSNAELMQNLESKKWNERSDAVGEIKNKVECDRALRGCDGM